MTLGGKNRPQKPVSEMRSIAHVILKLQNGLVLMSLLLETWNILGILCEKPFSRHISRALVQYGGAENEIK